ncbi:2828_t:CDS:1, partial [Racocetra fulgida]
TLHSTTISTNNPYITSDNNKKKDDNNSKKDPIDQLISDKENLDELIEAENHKDIETHETGDLLPPLENSSTNNLEVNSMEGVSKVASLKDTKIKATTNTRIDDEGFIEVSYKRQIGRTRNSSLQYVEPYNRDRKKGKYVPKK